MYIHLLHFLVWCPPEDACISCASVWNGVTEMIVCCCVRTLHFQRSGVNILILISRSCTHNEIYEAVVLIFNFKTLWKSCQWSHRRLGGTSWLNSFFLRPPSSTGWSATTVRPTSTAPSVTSMGAPERLKSGWDAGMFGALLLELADLGQKKKNPFFFFCYNYKKSWANYQLF